MATSSTPTYTTRHLDADTWTDFAHLVEANNGVWGGCWCMGFHVEGLGSDQGRRRRDLYAAFGFERDRKIAKWCWVMHRRVTGATTKAP